jgi:uncharacterized protein affecting Mg2+/Co2+ transport
MKFTIFAISGLLIASLAGCTTNPDILPTATNTPAPTSSPSEAGSPTAAPSTDSGLDSETLREAQDAFPDAPAIDSFTKEEVQLAAYTAQRYITDAYTRNYLVNGNWIAGGADVAYLRDNFNYQWTPALDSYVQETVALYKAAKERGDTATATDLTYKLMNLMLFVDMENQPVLLDDQCAIDADSTCIVNGVPDFTKDFSVSNNEGNLVVTVSFKVDVRYVYNEQIGSTSFVFDDYKMNFAKNVEAWNQDDEGTPSFLLNGAASNTQIMPWEPTI